MRTRNSGFPFLRYHHGIVVKVTALTVLQLYYYQGYLLDTLGITGSTGTVVATGA